MGRVYQCCEVARAAQDTAAPTRGTAAAHRQKSLRAAGETRAPLSRPRRRAVAREAPPKEGVCAEEDAVERDVPGTEREGGGRGGGTRPWLRQRVRAREGGAAAAPHHERAEARKDAAGALRPRNVDEAVQAARVAPRASVPTVTAADRRSPTLVLHLHLDDLTAHSSLRDSILEDSQRHSPHLSWTDGD